MIYTTECNIRMPVYVGIEDNPFQWSEFSGWKSSAFFPVSKNLGSCVVIMEQKMNLESPKLYSIIKIMVEV